MVQARIVRWGNSQGVRIPRPLLEQIGAGAGADVTIEARDGEIIIRPAPPHPRAGWAESFAALAASGATESLWPAAMEDDFDKDLPPW